MIRRSFMRHWLITTTALAGVLPLIGLGASIAQANPQGGTVAQGSATITQTDPKTVTVNQSTDKAVINWQSFSIGAGETTRFVQPSSSASVLNRVTGDQVSQILGNLQANGRVYLVNPNGIVFGAGSKIDVAALVASTANIKDSNFMAGNLRFDIPGKASAQIINEGAITAADGGLVALVAPSLRNSGIIQARLGKVAMVGANGVTLDLYGDNLILFQASDKVTEQLVGADGQPLATQIDNSGKLYADGGWVLMNANAAKGVVDNAINTTGLVSARTVEQRGGEIVLKGEDGGVVQVAGTLDASGKEAGQKGGTVNVLGEKVGLVGSASIDVSGDASGGTALVGGDYQGKGTVRNAQVTYMGQDATINANALTTGNGGKVILWADGTTRSYGRTYAQGGAQGGDGGFVETSGKGYLEQTGNVSTLAPKGKTGTWLLDPQDIVIANGGAQSLDGTNAALFADNAGGSSTIAPSVINAATSNVVLQATRDITFSNAIAMAIAGKALVAEAGRDLRVNANISTNNGDIYLLGGYSAASGQGGVNAGAVDINGATVSSGTGKIVVTGKGSTTLKENEDNVNYGQNGVVLRNEANIQSTSGNITVKGNAVGSFGYGVHVAAGGISSVDGDVNVIGTSDNTTGNSFGVALWNNFGGSDANISVTGSGGLRVEGTAGSATWSYGVWVASGKIAHSGTLAPGKTFEIIGHGKQAGHMSWGVGLTGTGQISTVNADVTVSGDADTATSFDSFGISANGYGSDTAYFKSTGTGSIILVGKPGASAGSRRAGIAFSGNSFDGEKFSHIQAAGGNVTLSADSFYIRNTTTYGALVRGAGTTSQIGYNAAPVPTSTAPTPPTPPAPGSNSGTGSGSNNSPGSNSTTTPSNDVLNGEPGKSGEDGTRTGGSSGQTPLPLPLPYSNEVKPLTAKDFLQALSDIDNSPGTAVANLTVGDNGFVKWGTIICDSADILNSIADGKYSDAEKKGVEVVGGFLIANLGTFLVARDLGKWAGESLDKHFDNEVIATVLYGNMSNPLLKSVYIENGKDAKGPYVSFAGEPVLYESAVSKGLMVKRTVDGFTRYYITQNGAVNYYVSEVPPTKSGPFGLIGQYTYNGVEQNHDLAQKLAEAVFRS